MKMFIIVVTLLIISFITSCSHLSINLSSAYDDVKFGDLETIAIRLFGSPSVREEQEILFSRYASRPS